MNTRQFRVWSEWLKRSPTRRGGLTAALAVAVAAFCGATASVAAAVGDESGSLSLSTATTKIHDAEVTTKVKAALLGTDNLSSGNIHVKTRDGDVVLTGSVPDGQQRTLAVNTTKQIEGVQHVRDQLTIQPK
ncbi:hyperosmotically inducible periplasmic protein [Burkholderia multivorans]